MIRCKISILLLLSVLLCISTYAQHPCLTLTKKGVDRIKQGLGSAPLFDKRLSQIKKEIDQSIENGIDVPIPKDMAGGYTHEQHKANYKLMHKAGNLYQFTGDSKYAEFVKEMLFEYAEMYPNLPLHPTMKSYATGKIFWQCLNDANWLVFTSQAYDCIYDFLSKEERRKLEEELFIPYANFLSEENPKFFNRIHNHSTWANAAVGLIALVMDNDALLEKALYGLKNDGIDPAEMDNDGGFIKKDGVRQVGFLAQLDYSFSPEGYFTEGPYYQRYAIFPFLVFSHALHNKRPDLKIFKYRDGILKKATNTLLLLTDPQGNFFPINDAQKGMSFKTYELVTAVDLMLMVDDSQKSLLEWAALQDEVAFNEAGFFVAQKLAQTKPEKPIRKSIILGDGINGDEGGIAVLRLGNTELLCKFASHGMGHGHFDRLSYSLYDKMGEVIQDYGAVRWVNIDQKAGGRYLPENKTFGKQTIAHNTVTINEMSQFDASVKEAEKSTPDLYLFDASNPNVKIVSTIENNAYKNIHQQRTLMLYQDADFVNPLLIDLFIINADEVDEKTTYDLPLWYLGHHMKSSFNCSKQLEDLSSIGKDNGYQHIWKESACLLNENNFQFNWFNNSRFYTQTSYGQIGDNIIMGRTGANDPNYNLRSDPVLIHRKKNTGNAVFFNIIESHGKYSTITEIPINPYSQIDRLKIIHTEKDYIICSFSNQVFTWNIFLALSDNNPESLHEVFVKNTKYKWKGSYEINKTKLSHN